MILRPSIILPQYSYLPRPHNTKLPLFGQEFGRTHPWRCRHRRRRVRILVRAASRRARGALGDGGLGSRAAGASGLPACEEPAECASLLVGGLHPRKQELELGI